MKKFLILFLGVIFGLMVLMSAFVPYIGAADILVPVDYPTIQDAIDNANEGDTVYVYSGYYNEQVVIDKPIDLIGENKETTYVGRIQLGNAPPGDVCSNIHVSGFHLGNYYVSHNYIFVYANDSSVTDCIVEEIDTSSPESHGIGLYGDNLNISNNIVRNLQFQGLFGRPTNSEIYNNEIYSIGCNGIHFEGECCYNLIHYNDFSGCGMYCIRLRNSLVHDNEICYNDFNGLSYQDLGVEPRLHGDH